MKINLERIKNDHKLDIKVYGYANIPIDKLSTYKVYCITCNNTKRKVITYLITLYTSITTKLNYCKTNIDLWLVKQGYKYETPKLYLKARNNRERYQKNFK